MKPWSKKALARLVAHPDTPTLRDALKAAYLAGIEAAQDALGDHIDKLMAPENPSRGAWDASYAARDMVDIIEEMKGRVK